MKITYHKTENILQIKDGIKLQHGFIYLIGTINLFNAVLNLYEKRSEPFDSMHFIWLFVGMISVGIILYMILKKSVKENIFVDEIIRIKEKSWMGRKRFILKLKNGKERDVFELQKPTEIENFQKLIYSLRPGMFF